MPSSAAVAIAASQIGCGGVEGALRGLQVRLRRAAQQRVAVYLRIGGIRSLPGFVHRVRVLPDGGRLGAVHDAVGECLVGEVLERIDPCGGIVRGLPCGVYGCFLVGD